MRYLSLFSGMEAAHLAWGPLGWTCAGVAEIDAAPCAVLAYRLANVPNLGSVVDITPEQVGALGRIDVVIGGSPCQDLSVAGKRKGLAGARSSLFHQQVRIFDAARSLCGARWLIWENVPGAFSSHAGRDFALVVGTMAGLELAVPEDGWASEGVALGQNGLVEWCVLDAQWFGLAQRRKRVFAVLDSGDWAHRPPVLLEPESMRGDSPPRREAGEEVAGTLSSRTEGGGGLGTDFELNGGLMPETCGALTDGAHNGGGSTGKTPTRAGYLPAVSMCLNAGAMGRIDAESETLLAIGGYFDVAHALRAQPQLSHQDDRDTLVVAHALPPLVVAFDTTQITHPENRCNPQPGDPCHPLAATSHAPAIAFDARQSDVITYGDKSGPLDTDGHSIAVAYRWAASASESMSVDDVAPTIRAGRNGEPATAVRRLTPKECERLQGAPDDWTLVPRGKKPMKDGPRYKMLGNSFAVPCIRWIGERIDAAEAHARRAEAA